jgi:uncharacterized membrane protein (UPF0182 family)
VVAYQGSVAMGQSLDDALSQLFGGSATPSGQAAPAVAASAAAPAGGAGARATAQADAAIRALVAEARTHYDNAISAQRAGDWARYGQEIRQLGDVLARIGQGGP